MTERRGNPITKIPEGPKSELGAYLYRQFLNKIIPGIIDTTIQIKDFAQTQAPTLADRLEKTARRLSIIAASAASGNLDRTNFSFPAFPDNSSAESFAEFISTNGSEIIPVPSSITNRLHNPNEAAMDGMARQSRIPGLTTLVTEVTASRIGSHRRYYTVKLIGRSHLQQSDPQT